MVLGAVREDSDPIHPKGDLQDLRDPQGHRDLQGHLGPLAVLLVANHQAVPKDSLSQAGSCSKDLVRLRHPIRAVHYRAVHFRCPSYFLIDSPTKGPVHCEKGLEVAHLRRLPQDSFLQPGGVSSLPPSSQRRS